MSTPTSLDLPAGVAHTTVSCDRGTFAALDAFPETGACELGTALLVPGYTGSKEDFLPVLGELAAGGRRVLAIDMRGQYQTPGPDDPASYGLRELGADIAALARAAGVAHLVGHSFGGLVAREAVIAATARASTGPATPPPDPPASPVPADGTARATAVLQGAHKPASLTLLSSGPGALPGPRAEELRFFLAAAEGAAGPGELRARVAGIWHDYLKPQAVAEGAPDEIVRFLQERMLANSPAALVSMARSMLAAEDRTADLAAAGLPVFVLYGEEDNSWPPAAQENMAARLSARRACIPGAAHSPAVEAPATTAHALTDFWNSAETVR